jgi:hypothetical protein
MNKTVLSIVCITALCSAFGTVGVFAGSNLEQIQAYLNHSITFSVNNADWTAKDEDGSTLAPVIYNGHTYLPVRAAGQALGADVVWDEANYKVKISQTVSDSTYGNPYKDVNPDAKKDDKYNKNRKDDKQRDKHGRDDENQDGDHNDNDNKFRDPKNRD